MLRRALLFVFLLGLSLSARADNPFGLMLWPAPGQDLSLMAARAGALNVAWYRPPTLYVDHWRGDAPCPACRALARSGLAVTVTIRNGGHDRPSPPPEDLDAYGRIVAAMATQWNPAMIVVEDEENRLQRYSGGAQDYRRQLETACAVAHDRGSQCANGGLSYEAVTGLTWLTLLREGKADLACDYARRTLGNRLSDACAFRRAEQVPADLQDRLLCNAEALLAVYRDSPIDAVNFHWYGADAMALAQSIDILGRLTGKPLMSNEIGQRRGDANPSHVRPLMRAAMAGGLKLAIWYSVDNENAVSLFDDQGRLRPAGQEFAHQMSGRK